MAFYHPGRDSDATIPNHVVIDLSRNYAAYLGSDASVGYAKAGIFLA